MQLGKTEWVTGMAPRRGAAPRLLVALGLAALMLVMGAGGLSRPERGLAVSSGTVQFDPNPRMTAWNSATAFAVDIVAKNVVVDTQCPLDPEHPENGTADCGLGGFEFVISWDPSLLNYVSIVGGDFLSRTGRSQSCLEVESAADHVHYLCTTLAPPPPMGPQGGGRLATLRLRATSSVPAPGGLTSLTLSELELVDVHGNPFPSTAVSGQVQFLVCIDVSGDGLVDFTDTLDILALFGHPVPPTDPKYDPTGDGLVDLSDALYSLQEFGESCTLS
jgi:hypothetical protein